MSAPSPDSSVTGVDGEEILCGALQALGFDIERNLILQKDNGQEADPHTQSRWRTQVDAWKYFTARRAGHVSRANKAWFAWRQKYAPNEASAWVVEMMMWQAAWWDLRFVTEIDLVIKPPATEECELIANFPTPFLLYRPGAASSYLCGRDFRRLFTHGILVESTLANGSDVAHVDKSAKLHTLDGLAQKRRRNEGIAPFYNGVEPGSPPARNIPAGTLVIYFAQRATMTYPERLGQHMLAAKEQELQQERKQRKRKEQEVAELEEELKRLRASSGQ